MRFVCKQAGWLETKVECGSRPPGRRRDLACARQGQPEPPLGLAAAGAGGWLGPSPPPSAQHDMSCACTCHAHAHDMCMCMHMHMCMHMCNMPCAGASRVWREGTCLSSSAFTCPSSSPAGTVACGGPSFWRTRHEFYICSAADLVSHSVELDVGYNRTLANYR